MFFCCVEFMEKLGLSRPSVVDSLLAYGCCMDEPTVSFGEFIELSIRSYNCELELNVFDRLGCCGPRRVC